jgi:hypothetical protein
MKKISYLLLASCICWVTGWTLLATSLSSNDPEPTELTEKKAPILKELTSF